MTPRPDRKPGKPGTVHGLYSTTISGDPGDEAAIPFAGSLQTVGGPRRVLFTVLVVL